MTSASYALSGLSEIIKFFNSKQNKSLVDKKYEIPIKINTGSWETAIIDNPLTSALIAGASIFAGSYLKKAGEKIAENDFKDFSFKKIIERSMHALVEYVKIKKQGITIDDIENSKKFVKNGIIIAIITLPNGECIEIENSYLEWYKQMPPTLLQKITYIIEEERRLELGVVFDGKLIKETINENEAGIFNSITITNEEEIILPLLVHNNRYKLKGYLSRGNQSSNSLGFRYAGYTLNCHPETGDVVQFKDSLFKTCIIDCYVNRNTKTNLKLDRKPTLIIISSSPIEEDLQENLKFD